MGVSFFYDTSVPAGWNDLSPAAANLRRDAVPVLASLPMERGSFCNSRNRV
jgi:hypothetical protein